MKTLNYVLWQSKWKCLPFNSYLLLVHGYGLIQVHGWFIFNYLRDWQSDVLVLAFLESQKMENIAEESLITWASGKGLGGMFPPWALRKKHFKWLLCCAFEDNFPLQFPACLQIRTRVMWLYSTDVPRLLKGCISMPKTYKQTSGQIESLLLARSIPSTL